MGACCSKNTIDDKIVTIEKQPWSVVQKTLATGDLLFLSGFEWVPQVTGRKSFSMKNTNDGLMLDSFI